MAFKNRSLEERISSLQEEIEKINYGIGYGYLFLPREAQVNYLSGLKGQKRIYQTELLRLTKYRTDRKVYK